MLVVFVKQLSVGRAGAYLYRFRPIAQSDVYGKVANPWEENSTPFWDTGNIGVTTASQSNSTPTDDTAAGSGKAARLESKNVIVKFAAGNLFTGKFIKVDGTNGILNFGQPFTGRPTKLKGYYKYTTAPITDLPAEGSQDYTRFQNYKGKPDTCSNNRKKHWAVLLPL